MALLTQHTVDGEGLEFQQGSDPNSSVRGRLRSATTLTGSRTWELPDTSGVISVQDVQFVMKGTDESRTNSTTATIDDDLQVPVTANSVYHLTVGLSCQNTNSVPDFKWGLGGPTGCYVYNATLASSGIDIAGGTAISTSSATNTVAQQTFIVTTGAESGTLAVYWAQNTLDAVNASILKSYSFIELRKVS